MNPLLVTMSGPGQYNIKDLSNFEVGVIFLSELNRLMPGLTWGQLAAGLDRPEVMAGWWTDLKKGVSDTVSAPGSLLMDGVRSVGGVIGDAARYTGDSFGELVRLATDEKVIDGAVRGYQAFNEGGGVAGFWGGDYTDMFKSGEGGGDAQNYAAGIWDFITNLGAGAKKAATQNQAGMMGGNMVLLIGGGLLLALLFGRGGRR